MQNIYKCNSKLHGIVMLNVTGIRKYWTDIKLPKMKEKGAKLKKKGIRRKEQLEDMIEKRPKKALKVPSLMHFYTLSVLRIFRGQLEAMFLQLDIHCY